MQKRNWAGSVNRCQGGSMSFDFSQAVTESLFPVNIAIPICNLYFSINCSVSVLSLLHSIIRFVWKTEVSATRVL